MIEIEKPNITTANLSSDGTEGTFIVEPLERGYGITLGNSLRRVLLEIEALSMIEDSSRALSKFRTLTPHSIRAATTMIVTLPIVCVYPFLQKYFLSGITIGAVKG